MAISGVGLVAVGGVWLMGFVLPDSSVFSTPDFLEYCGSVVLALNGDLGQWSHNRSLLSGLPSIFAAKHLGIVDGLLVGSMFGQLILGMGLYLWGRALHSPLAGLAAVLCAAALVPLASMGRYLTFYPIIVGVLTLAMATTAVAWRWTSAWTCALAGAGAGLAFLIDPRGLLWGLTIIPMAVVAACWDRRIERIPLRLLALAAPVWLAWVAGRHAYFPHTTTLEALADLTKGWQDIIKLPRLRAPLTAADGYVWGYSNPLNIPSTLQFLASQTIPDVVRNSERTQKAYADTVAPLMPLAAGAAAVALAGLWRRPVMGLVLLGGSVPFAVALNSAIEARFAGLRFLSNGFPIVALVMGLCWATLALGALPAEEPSTAETGRPWRSLAAAGILLAVIMGVIPTHLSPVASWRKVELQTDSNLRAALSPEGMVHRWPECSNKIRLDPYPVWIDRLP